MKGSDVLNKLRSDKNSISSQVQKFLAQVGQKRSLLEQATAATDKALKDFVLYRLQVGETKTEVGQEIGRRTEALSQSIAKAQKQVARLQEDYALASQERQRADEQSQRSTQAWETHCHHAHAHWAVTPQAQQLEQEAKDIEYRLDFYLAEQKRWDGVLSDVENKLGAMPWFKALSGQSSSWLHRKMRALSGQDHNEKVLNNIKIRAKQIDVVVEGLLSRQSVNRQNVQSSVLAFQKNHDNGQSLFDAHDANRVVFEGALARYASIEKEYLNASSVLDQLLSDRNHFGEGVSKSTFDALVGLVENSMDLVDRDVRATPTSRDDDLLAEWKNAVTVQRQRQLDVKNSENEFLAANVQLDSIQKVIDLFSSRGWGSGNYTFSSLMWPAFWGVSSYQAFESAARYTPPVSTPTYSPSRSSNNSSWGSFGGGSIRTGGGFGGGGHRTGGGF